MVKKFLLKLKNKKILEKMDKIEISNNAMEQYRLCVRNNKNRDEEMIIKKLKRNFILGEDYDYRTKLYGNLHIYHKNNIITSIYNVRGGANRFSIDEKLKEELDYILDL